MLLIIIYQLRKSVIDLLGYDFAMMVPDEYQEFASLIGFFKENVISLSTN